MTEKTIDIADFSDIASLFGDMDKNIKLLEDKFAVSILSRDTKIKISGEEENVNKAKKVLDAMRTLLRQGETLNEQNIEYVSGLVLQGKEAQVSELGGDIICISSKGKPIRGKTFGQKQYVDMMHKNTITLGIGPAGTGKTYLAVAMAVRAFKNKEVSRIILTRPAVEAGEKLGFLPGDLQEKVDPYLRPLYDGLFEMLGAEVFSRYVEKGSIEVAPLAYMRGRTLDDSFIILDEAQNTTPEQMKMFLTRLGMNSKVVVTGDITQIDLGHEKKSGLIEVAKILADVKDIGIIHLTAEGVVRHILVQRIIRAYDEYYSKE